MLKKCLLNKAVGRVGYFKGFRNDQMNKSKGFLNSLRNKNKGEYLRNVSVARGSQDSMSITFNNVLIALLPLIQKVALDIRNHENNFLKNFLK